LGRLELTQPWLLIGDDVNTQNSLRYLSYNDSGETIAPDEEKTVQEVIASLARWLRQAPAFEPVQENQSYTAYP